MKINILIRSMGPISEEDMVRKKAKAMNSVSLSSHRVIWEPLGNAVEGKKEGHDHYFLGTLSSGVGTRDKGALYIIAGPVRKKVFPRDLDAVVAKTPFHNHHTLKWRNAFSTIFREMKLVLLSLLFLFSILEFRNRGMKRGPQNYHYHFQGKIVSWSDDPFAILIFRL